MEPVGRGGMSVNANGAGAAVNGATANPDPKDVAQLERGVVGLLEQLRKVGLTVLNFEGAAQVGPRSPLFSECTNGSTASVNESCAGHPLPTEVPHRWHLLNRFVGVLMFLTVHF